MRTAIAFAVLAIGLTACASNPSTQTGGSTEGSTTDASSAPERKRVCKYEKTNGTGSRMERVCRYVDAG